MLILYSYKCSASQRTSAGRLYFSPNNKCVWYDEIATNVDCVFRQIGRGLRSLSVLLINFARYFTAAKNQFDAMLTHSK